MPSDNWKSIGELAKLVISQWGEFACQHCGETPPNVTLHFTQVLPVDLDGDAVEGNPSVACTECLAVKSALDLVRVQDNAQQKAGGELDEHGQAWGWEIANVLCPGVGYSREKLASIDLFVERIGVSETLDAARISVAKGLTGNETFKYFCGICWKKIRANEDYAK